MMDFSVILINVGVYTAPSIVALLTSMIAFVKFYEDKQLEVLASVNSEILLVMDSASTVDDKLKLIGLLLHKRTFYDRISVYADAYVLGLHDSPRERFIRLTEAGYRKDTKPDQLIDFREGRGPLMREALLSGNAMLNQGKMDFAFFSIIPVGQHVIFNISNNESFPDFFATESHELLLGLMPALRTINDRLIEAGSRMAFALESLRILRGDGRWDMEIGSIFLDINDYSDYVEKYGEAYANFVAQVYLPAICQRVRSWAVREGSTAGDAVYLVCISDLMQDRCPMSDAVYKAIAEILRFVEEEGSEMCRLQGFPAIRLQVGANAGAGTVICDAFQVRTSGAVVTEASRLQKASLPGWTFVHVDLANKWPTYGVLRVEQSELELKKMNRLKGCKVGRKKNTNLVA
jgi:class 3 adenylate cyclase